MAVAAVCLLAGCSATDIVYDNLPWLLRQRIDARFDLTSTQTSQLKGRIAEIAAWHRREELPRYAAALEHLEAAFADGLTRAEVDHFVALARDARARLVEAAIPPTAEFLQTVNRKQIEEFEETHREAMKEDSERLALSPAEQNEVRVEKTLDNLEDWFGDFDKVQTERVRALVEALPNSYASWLKRREFQHRRFVELLEQKPGLAATEKRLRAWWLSEDSALPPDMAAQREQFWASGLTFLLDVDALLTDSQRSRATRKLRGYRQDFVRLSRANPEDQRERPRI